MFKQASCIPDQRGICPTSLRVSDTVTKLWVRCGDACWSKNIFHDKDEVSKGASIYDVCTEGGGGVSPKEDVVREVA